MPDRSVSRSRDLATVFREDRYDVLLGLLLAMVAAAPFVRTNVFAAAAIFGLAVASMLVTFRSSGVRVTWPLVLVAGSAGLAAFVLALTTTERSQWRALAAILLAGVLAVGPPLILRRIFQRPSVTLQDIFAAVSVYLQTGLAFAFIYAAVDCVSPEAFLNPGLSENGRARPDRGTRRRRPRG